MNHGGTSNLYKGYRIALFQMLPQISLMLPFYDYIASRKDYGAHQSIFASSVAASAVALLVYPIDTVKKCA